MIRIVIENDKIECNGFVSDELTCKVFRKFMALIGYAVEELVVKSKVFDEDDEVKVSLFDMDHPAFGVTLVYTGPDEDNE